MYVHQRSKKGREREERERERGGGGGGERKIKTDREDGLRAICATNIQIEGVPLWLLDKNRF